jgi:hypothetical protein
VDEVTIDVLNSFLRDEFAAIEAYDEVLRGRSRFSGKMELSLCRRSHVERASILRDKIVSLGGRAVAPSGRTGAWSRLAETGAGAVGAKMAIGVLGRGEDTVLSDYRRGLPDVDPEVQVFLERMILPEEEYTHRTLIDLRRHLAAT